MRHFYPLKRKTREFGSIMLKAVSKNLNYFEFPAKALTFLPAKGV